MNYTQNAKIMQITEQTLVVGVDIAKKTHYARAFDYRGLEIANIIKFSNNHEGIQVFIEWIEKTMRKHGKTHAIVGMEPTGHYWFNLAHIVKNHGIKHVLVNSMHVKRTKELDDNLPTKNDRKDPKTIAMLVKDGRYLEPYIAQGIYAELRTAMDVRVNTDKKISSVICRIHRWIDIYFPEFSEVFKDIGGKSALITLQLFPTPDKIIKLGPEKILSYWRKEVKRGVGINKAKELVEQAEKSVGVKTGLTMAELEIQMLVNQYVLLTQQMEHLEQHIESMISDIPGVIEIIKITGIGSMTVAGFLAETGDINRFSHPKQIIKLAGLSLKENSSGKHQGKTTVCKRGRRKLRALLFRVILPLTSKNEEFARLHEYYTTRNINPLKKKQSLIVLCGKLIRILFAIFKKGCQYDPIKMMTDIKRPELSSAA